MKPIVQMRKQRPQREVTCPRPDTQIYGAWLAGYHCTEGGLRGGEVPAGASFPIGEAGPHPNLPRGSLLPGFTPTGS